MEKKTFARNPMDGSICKHCKHMVRRLIVPFDEAEYGIDREAMEIPPDEIIEYEHYFCNETAIDLDHLVLECNLYKAKFGLLSPEI